MFLVGVGQIRTCGPVDVKFQDPDSVLLTVPVLLPLCSSHQVLASACMAASFVQVRSDGKIRGANIVHVQAFHVHE